MACLLRGSRNIQKNPVRTLPWALPIAHTNCLNPNSAARRKRAASWRSREAVLRGGGRRKEDLLAGGVSSGPETSL